jgi:hypothetical protein
MKRNPSTLFAPDAIADLGHAALVPMPPEILVLYRACQRNTPWGTGVDDVLSADRLARGEKEQIAQAERLDPCDAMPSRLEERRDAYVRQRRYAVRAGIDAGMAHVAIARALGVSPGVMRGDLKASAR